MAIYHMNVQVIKRSEGRSAVAAAAYRSGTKLWDERYQKYCQYQHRSDSDEIAHAEILLPDNAPAEFANREVLWNAVEEAEKRKDAQLCREVNAALPRELTPEQNISLAREFAQSFVDKGMIADLTVHNIDSGNPHLHMMLTMRDVTEDGFGKKNRDWNQKDELEQMRSSWAELVNEKLAQANCEQRVSEKSYKEQGINQKPTVHEGYAVRAMEERAKAAAEEQGIDYEPVTRIARQNESIRNQNLITKLKEELEKHKTAITELKESVQEQLTAKLYQFCNAAANAFSQMDDMRAWRQDEMQGIDEEYERSRHW